jgi:Fe-S cluster assembly ATP-binding protein
VSALVIGGLIAGAGGHEVLHGIDLEVPAGEVHLVMGPNGSGKSTLAHAVMGRPGTTVTGGSVSIDGTELLGLSAWERARLGLFLGLQLPIEVPGVRLDALLGAALEEGDGSDAAPLRARIAAEAAAVGLDQRLTTRALNVDLSGGERKRNEVVQLGILRPRYCVLDEIDSGLDVDALGAVARRLETATEEWGMGVLAITHFARLSNELRADAVHVLLGGRIVASGGPELAAELETTGYAAYAGSR